VVRKKQYKRKSTSWKTKKSYKRKAKKVDRSIANARRLARFLKEQLEESEQ